jgi:hypothetical protein
VVVAAPFSQAALPGAWCAGRPHLTPAFDIVITASTTVISGLHIRLLDGFAGRTDDHVPASGLGRSSGATIIAAGRAAVPVPTRLPVRNCHGSHRCRVGSRRPQRRDALPDRPAGRCIERFRPLSPRQDQLDALAIHNEVAAVACALATGA